MAKPFIHHTLTCPTCGAKHEAKGNHARNALLAVWRQRAISRTAQIRTAAVVVSPDARTWRVFHRTEDARKFCCARGWSIRECVRRLRINGRARP